VIELDFDALLAAGVCDCGQPLEGHPPLPRPLPWGHGRPCSKTVLERGRGWDGRPAPVHSSAVQQRWAGYGKGLR
jgi:hypothetical protein